MEIVFMVLGSKAKKEIESITVGAVLDEAAYHLFAVKYGAMFRATIGAEALYSILKKIDLGELVTKLKEQFEKLKDTKMRSTNILRLKTHRWL